jgi:hypothetical protein
MTSVFVCVRAVSVVRNMLRARIEHETGSASGGDEAVIKQALINVDDRVTYTLDQVQC